MVKQMMRVMLVALVAGAMLTSACSSFKKHKAPVASPVAQATTAETPKPAETPANAPQEGHRPGDLVPFPAGAVDVIYFDYDKSDLRKDQQSRLEKNLQYLKDHPQDKVYIEGHCDERGTVEYNYALGMRRAQSVQNFFVKNGIAADRIAVASKGKDQPADPGHNEAAWAKNRRCEFMQMF